MIGKRKQSFEDKHHNVTNIDISLTKNRTKISPTEKSEQSFAKHDWDSSYRLADVIDEKDSKKDRRRSQVMAPIYSLKMDWFKYYQEPGLRK